MKKFVLYLILSVLFCFPLSSAESTFVSMANPWKETDAETVMTTLGLSFGVPDGSTDVFYLMNEGLSLAEMRFSLDGTEYTARIMPANECTDISGMYYSEWTHLETRPLGHCEAAYLTAGDAEAAIHLCLWYDIAPGLMYSLSCRTEKNVDILTVAQSVYLPAQGECAGDEDISLDDLYTELLFSLTGYQGTAGASLKEAAAAKNALAFAVQYPVDDRNTDAVRASILSAYSLLDEERKAEFLSNLPSVNALLETAFNKFESVQGLFEDAGIAEEMRTLLENASARDCWHEFFAAFVILYSPVG